MESIIGNLQKSVVFIGFLEDEKITYKATGFIITIDGYYHLVTAKHVIIDPETGERIDEKLGFFFNLEEGGLGNRNFKDIFESEIDWIFHEDENTDIAIIPIQLDPGVEDIIPIDSTKFLEFEKIIETQDVAFISYQPGTAALRKVNPVVRAGIVSQLKEEKTFLVDGAAFPGNSGGPLFLKSDNLTKTEDEIPAVNKPKLIGVVGAYLPYEEEAISKQTNQVRVVFQENSGLSECWSVDYLQEIIISDEFKKQMEHVKGLDDKESTSEDHRYKQVD